MGRRWYLGLVLLSAACGGSGGGGTSIVAPPPPPPPPPPPAHVAMTAASSTLMSDHLTDSVAVSLANSGGPGTFYLEFWGRDITVPSGCYAAPGQSCPPTEGQLRATSRAVTVGTGYAQSLAYGVPALVSSVRVFTASENSAVFVRTGCIVVDGSGKCPP